jgi:hypothetical protein
VPDYQREYVWGDREVARLLEDFDEQLSNDSEYFIGMVLVAPTAQGRLEVIDGQQRLTTLFLLICALRRRLLGDPGFSTIFSSLLVSTYTGSNGKPMVSAKLEPRYENADAVTGRLARDSLTPTELRSALKSEYVSLTGSMDRLASAYAQIVEFLDENYESDEAVEKYWGFVANRVIFIQISTDMGSALKIFETINERGVGLSPMDLLKNLLFTNVTPDKFSELRDRWKGVTSPLEAKREKPLRFLRYFLMASYTVSNGEGRKSNKSPDIIREDEIYDWMTDPTNAEVVGYASDPFGFVKTLSRAATLYLGFIDNRGNDGEPSPVVARLRGLTGNAFSLHYMLLLAAAPLSKGNFDFFVQQLECYLFAFIFTRAPSRELERNFSAWSDELRVIASLAEAPQADAIREFVRDRFGAGAGEKTRELVDALRRYSTRSAPQYRTKYLLARLTQFVDRAFDGSEGKGPQELDSYLNLEIEHILPQTPSDDLRTRWTSANPEFDYDEFVQKLGNLTLLEKPHNIVASHDPIDKKSDLYSKSANYLTRSLAGLSEVGLNTSVTDINQYLASAEVWNVPEIEARQERLTELAMRIWKVDD